MHPAKTLVDRPPFQHIGTGPHALVVDPEVGAVVAPDGNPQIAGLVEPQFRIGVPDAVLLFVERPHHRLAGLREHPADDPIALSHVGCIEVHHRLRRKPPMNVLPVRIRKRTDGMPRVDRHPTTRLTSRQNLAGELDPLRGRDLRRRLGVFGRRQAVGPDPAWIAAPALGLAGLGLRHQPRQIRHFAPGDLVSHPLHLPGLTGGGQRHGDALLVLLAQGAGQFEHARAEADHRLGLPQRGLDLLAVPVVLRCGRNPRLQDLLVQRRPHGARHVRDLARLFNRDAAQLGQLRGPDLLVRVGELSLGLDGLPVELCQVHRADIGVRSPVWRRCGDGRGGLVRRATRFQDAREGVTGLLLRLAGGEL